MERKYIANGSFSSSPSDMTCRVRLEILADNGQFTVPKVVIFNTSSVNLGRIYYQVDEVSLGRGNIVVFPDRIEWTGNNETVSSEFELGIYELNTHQLTPPFSSSRSIEKEVFDGNGTVKMTFNATPTDNLDYLEITVFAEETDHADSILLEGTATNEGFIDGTSPEKIRWEFDDPVIGHTYSASVNMTVIPKTDSATRYWAYTRIEGGYGSYTNSTSGSNQSMVEYTDSILGDVRIYFESPVDYCSTDADGEEYYERFKHFSEIVDDGEPHTIGMSCNAHKPCVRTVPSGTTVSWTNWEELVHTVTSDTGLWGSGNLSDGQSFTYTFDTPGTYTYHDALHPSVPGVVIVQDQAPTASFTYSPENPIVDQTITFNASCSYDPGGNITKYEWGFGDENTGTGEVVTHSYTTAGNYNATLTTTDDDGATNSTFRNIEVVDATPDIVFINTSVNSLCIGDADNDGKNEIVVTTGSNVTVWEHNPDGTYSVSWSEYIENVGWGVTAVVVGDVDNDGQNEIIAGTGSWGSYDVRIYEHSTGNSYSLAWNNKWSSHRHESVFVGDADNDGLNELLLIRNNPWSDDDDIAIFKHTSGNTYPLIGHKHLFNKVAHHTRTQ